MKPPLRNIIGIFGLLVALASANAAGTTVTDGNSFLRLTRGSVRILDGTPNAQDTNEQLAVAMAYIKGLLDGANLAKAFGAKFTLQIPTEASFAQMIRIVDKYAREHPENLDHPAAELVWNALTAAFPVDKR